MLLLKKEKEKKEEDFHFNYRHKAIQPCELSDNKRWQLQEKDVLPSEHS